MMKTWMWRLFDAVTRNVTWLWGSRQQQSVVRVWNLMLRFVTNCYKTLGEFSPGPHQLWWGGEAQLGAFNLIIQYVDAWSIAAEHEVHCSESEKGWSEEKCWWCLMLAWYYKRNFTLEQGRRAFVLCHHPRQRHHYRCQHQFPDITSTNYSEHFSNNEKFFIMSWIVMGSK